MALITERQWREWPMVACASSRQADSDRWTELSIRIRPNTRSKFFCIVVGRSLLRGERDNVRTSAFRRLRNALDWFHDSALRDTLIAQAEEWQETMEAKERAQEAGDHPAGFTGNTMSEALAWLYPARSNGRHVMPYEDAERVEIFGDEWGCGSAIIASALRAEKRGAPLPEWAFLFISALRYFDRAGFWAQGREHLRGIYDDA